MGTRLDHLSEETRDQLAEVALNLSNNAKTRKGFLGLLKQSSPNTPIPEIDEVNAVEAKIAEERKARESFEQEQRNRWFQEDLAKTKNTVRDRFSLSDDDFQKMEKMIVDKQLPADYTWAAQLYRNQTDAAAPTNYGTGGYGPLDIQKNAKEFDGLMDDTDNWASRTAHEMIDAMQKKGRSQAF